MSEVRENNLAVEWDKYQLAIDAAALTFLRSLERVPAVLWDKDCREGFHLMHSFTKEERNGDTWCKWGFCLRCLTAFYFDAKGGDNAIT